MSRRVSARRRKDWTQSQPKDLFWQPRVSDRLPITAGGSHCPPRYGNQSADQKSRPAAYHCVSWRLGYCPKACRTGAQRYRFATKPARPGFDSLRSLSQLCTKRTYQIDPCLCSKVLSAESAILNNLGNVGTLHSIGQSLGNCPSSNIDPLCLLPTLSNSGSMASSTSLIGSASSKVLKVTSCDRKVTVVKVPALGLYIVSDADNLGPNWIRVHFRKNVYTTHYLMGGDEATMCPIARFLAQNIIRESSTLFDFILAKAIATNDLSLNFHAFRTQSARTQAWWR